MILKDFLQRKKNIKIMLKNLVKPIFLSIFASVK